MLELRSGKKKCISVDADIPQLCCEIATLALGVSVKIQSAVIRILKPAHFKSHLDSSCHTKTSEVKHNSNTFVLQIVCQYVRMIIIIITFFF